MEKRVTIYDISKALNLSGTAVYKALNDKPRIGEDTRKLVIETAEAMGYKANKVARSLSRKPIKIGVVFGNYHSGFTGEIIKGMQWAFDELVDYKVEGIFGSFEPPYDVQTTLKKLKDVVGKGVDGIIFEPWLLCKENTDAINELVDKNIPVITINSDEPDSKRIAYVRQDGRMVGDMAAQLLSISNTGKNNAIFIGNRDVGIHKEVLEGFTKRIKQMDLNVVAVYETQDDDTIAYYAAENLMKTYPNVDGLFVGTAHSTSILRKITELGMTKKIKIVCTDIFPELVEYFENDTIIASIYQDPFNQGKLAVETLYKYIAEVEIPSDDLLVDPQILIKSNYEQHLPK